MNDQQHMPGKARSERADETGPIFVPDVAASASSLRLDVAGVVRQPRTPQALPTRYPLLTAHTFFPKSPHISGLFRAHPASPGRLPLPDSPGRVAPSQSPDRPNQPAIGKSRSVNLAACRHAIVLESDRAGEQAGSQHRRRHQVGAEVRGVREIPGPVLPPTRRLWDSEAVNLGEQLCGACGLCCDGTLFDLVKLEAGDDAPKLKALGLPVKVSRGKEPIARFPQPCAALCEDRTCRLYADRPWQCRAFECGVFKDAKAGRITFAAALRLVKQARRRADKARRLLRELGDTDEHRALGERFHRVSERLESDTHDAAAHGTFADLSLVMHHLKLQTLNRFYTKTAAHD